MTGPSERQTIESIEVSLTARSKAGRYYSMHTLRERLAALDGTFFREPDGPWYLRTTRTQPTGPPEHVVIVFDLADATATIRTQTTSHYDWSRLEHVQDPPFLFDVDLDRSLYSDRPGNRGRRAVFFCP